METVSEHKREKTKATKVAIFVAFCLAVSKAVVGFITGSLSILSSAVDSILDIAASFFNFIALKKSEEPADDGHQYGHGKYEAMATFIQSIIIFVSGLFILISAWDKFIHTVFLTIYLRYMAKKENSLVLEADAMHYSVDLYTNIGILLALFIIKFTGLTVIDSIVAAIVAIYIIFSAIKLSLQVSKQLLDSSIEEEVYNKLVKVLESFGEYHLDFHRLRTRSAGNEIFIDMHLTLCRKLTLEEVHQITDIIEHAISKELKGADVTIHPEPCDHTGDDDSECNSKRIRYGLEKLKG